jgi:hypothetical protein
LRRTVSPAPPSKSTLSGTTTAARPWIVEERLDVLDEVELLVARRRPEVVARDRERPRAASSPSSVTTITLDFLPNGGLASTIE